MRPALVAGGQQWLRKLSSNPVQATHHPQQHPSVADDTPCEAEKETQHQTLQPTSRQRSAPPSLRNKMPTCTSWHHEHQANRSKHLQGLRTTFARGTFTRPADGRTWAATPGHHWTRSSRHQVRQATKIIRLIFTRSVVFPCGSGRGGPRDRDHAVDRGSTDTSLGCVRLLSRSSSWFATLMCSASAGRQQAHRVQNASLTSSTMNFVPSCAPGLAKACSPSKTIKHGGQHDPLRHAGTSGDPKTLWSRR